jgi:hypothetical protein
MYVQPHTGIRMHAPATCTFHNAVATELVCSFGELEWMGSGQAVIEDLNPWRTLPKMSYKDGYQQKYFCLDNFEDGAYMLKEFALTIAMHNGNWLPQEQ